VPETYSTSTHLFEALGIPAGTKGTLPRSARTRAGLDAETLEDVGETGRGPRKGARESVKAPAAAPAVRTNRSRKRTRGQASGLASVQSGDEGSAVIANPASFEPSDGADADGTARRRRRGRGRGAAGGIGQETSGSDEAASA
jgi:hypothetical protein